jgi:TonB-dependent SusC/RagA subfamily outer membrane receptor
MIIAQSTVISGRVIAEDTHKPLDGAVVIIKTQRKLQDLSKNIIYISYAIDRIFISNMDLIQTGVGNPEQSNPLSDVNPLDIESVRILKDANVTAIYGSQSANGVTIVTTKRGCLNARPKLSFNVYQGWSNTINQFKVTTGGPQTATLFNESYWFKLFSQQETGLLKTPKRNNGISNV